MSIRRRVLRPWPLAFVSLAALLVLGFVWVRPWYKEHYRPMFWYLAHGERSFLNPWGFEFPTADEEGNFAVPDNTLNLLLLVVAPRQGVGRDFWNHAWGSLRSSANRSRAILQLDSSGSRPVQIDRTTDALIVILPDGSQSRAPLKCGEAMRMFQTIQLIHLLGERTGRTILSSLQDLVDSQDAELRQVIATALIAAGSQPTTLTAPG